MKKMGELCGNTYFQVIIGFINLISWNDWATIVLKLLIKKDEG